MQLHMILKFGSFVALLDLLNIILFQNLYIEMSDIIYNQSKYSPYIFYGEALKV